MKSAAMSIYYRDKLEKAVICNKNSQYILLLLSAMCLFHVSDASSQEICKRSISSPIDLMKNLFIQNKGESLYEDTKIVAYLDKDNLAVFLFTKSANPAHPAIACRMPVEDAGKYRIFSDIRCASDKDSCDRFAQSIIALNDGRLK